MFTSMMSDGEATTMHIEDYSYEVVLKLLEYFYCGQIDIDEYNHEYLMELLRKPHKLSKEELRGLKTPSLAHLVMSYFWPFLIFC